MTISVGQAVSLPSDNLKYQRIVNDKKVGLYIDMALVIAPGRVGVSWNSGKSVCEPLFRVTNKGGKSVEGLTVCFELKQNLSKVNPGVIVGCDPVVLSEEIMPGKRYDFGRISKFKVKEISRVGYAYGPIYGLALEMTQQGAFPHIPCAPNFEVTSVVGKIDGTEQSFLLCETSFPNCKRDKSLKTTMMRGIRFVAAALGR